MDEYILVENPILVEKPIYKATVVESVGFMREPGETIYFNHTDVEIGTLKVTQGFKSYEDCVEYTITIPELERNKVTSCQDEKPRNFKLLSDEGWDYYNEAMNNLCKDDPGGPENIRTAIWYVRKEIRQRRKNKDEAIENACKKYEVEKELLISRIQSNFRFWGHALKK